MNLNQETELRAQAATAGIGRFFCGALLALVAILSAACGKSEKPAAAPTAAKSASAPSAAPDNGQPLAVLLLAGEDVLTVGASAGTAGAAGGPVITGSLQPEKRADLRAEAAAVVVQIAKDNGDVVKRGDLLVRLDDAAIRESLTSAQASATAAQQAYEQGERTVARLKSLRAEGMASMQALEDAEVRRNSAQSELAAARSRVATAQQQLRRTEVRAPFDGVVAERKASVGDTAQVGKELLKVIDPSTMRFEGLVSADRVAQVKAGQAVRFRVHGVEGEFAGTVKRVDATADATTRQARVTVAFSDQSAGKASVASPRVAGLYAEGYIDVGAAASGAALASALTLPDSAIVRSGNNAFVWRIKDERIAKVAVQLGTRDVRTGDWPVISGVAAGEQLLRHPGSTLAEGQKVERKAATTPAAASAAR
jgi:membrane fusion protein, multidrug efflux system